MDGKPRRRTRERILETALRLFNDFGEPNVTTTVIADEMDISPGNLYYHFNNKDEIVNALFADYEREIGTLLGAPEQRPHEVEDIWFFLHLLFETIWKYRFLYRDINDLLTRNRLVETHFRRILAQKHETGTTICRGLAASGLLAATPAQIPVLVTNMTLVATFWLSYEHARNPRGAPDIGHGIYQVMSLAAPYLQGEARRLLEKLSTAYLDTP
ncbi:TetR/AcrR family transcriptional regulator [uncultured Dechloromonas sp.]|uniref:TetR/AcrR family transcriptional regulator n=1 Tax=uncultured Dechloromonas sp. TaxID=171719 RepID=UPI0025DC90EE|nr:TetR/AcrR family transcriptional regulator [uncultured Dechloromonas sp.]